MNQSIYFDPYRLIDGNKGKLPHWHQNGKLQFVTFHLADSLPQGVLANLKLEKDNWLKNHPQPWSLDAEKEYHCRFSQSVDRWLDSNYGSCALKSIEVAGIVEEALNYFNGTKYLLHAWVIMPNHIHVLIEMLESYTANNTIHSWKSYTAKRINKLLNKAGQFWQYDFFDRMIRDEQHYCNVINYIRQNINRGGVKWWIP